MWHDQLWAIDKDTSSPRVFKSFQKGGDHADFQLCRSLNAVLTASELKIAGVSFNNFPFWSGTIFMKKKSKIRL